MAMRSKKKRLDHGGIKPDGDILSSKVKSKSLSRHSHNGEHNNKNGDLIIEGSPASSESIPEPDYDDSMPDFEEIDRRFAALLDAIELSPERACELQQKSPTLKWKMIQGQDAMQDGKRSVRFYLDQLERHLMPQLYTKHPSKKMLKGIINVELLLTSLEVDLRANPNVTWLREFIDEPNCGHIVLLKFLNHIQQYVSSSSTPNGTPKKKFEILCKDSNDEHLCLQCIKAITRNKYGFQTILSAPRSLSTMARCLRLSNTKTRITVLKLFTQACEQANGHEKVIKAMEDYKIYCGEKYRYEGLVLSIMTKPCNPSYQETVLKFLNAVIIHAPSMNMRVYHQQEIENASFSPDTVEETLDGADSRSVKKELAIWKENYIDVANVMDEFVTLRGRTVILRDEVNLLQSKNKDIENEKLKVTEEKKDLETRLEDFKLRALELQANIENLKKHRQESSASNEEVTNALEDAIDDILHTTEAPPPPPPLPVTTTSMLPPAPPPPGSPITKKESLVRLPLLNWSPIMVTDERSIFKSTDNLTSFETSINFKDFESKFALKKSADQDMLRQKQEQALKALSSKISLLSANKARNLVITKRRIGKTATGIQEAIARCDLVALPGEHAELLLKFVPTKDELASLAKNAKEFERFGEAEKFLFQMAKVERYEAKLSVMAYIGLFDELLRSVSPRIDAILTASSSIINSKKMKRVFEIILAFGNRMNGSRRGYAQGFKLESLSKLQDIKSNDRQITFLNYLADLIKTKFPEMANFYADFDLESSTKVSLQMLAADVQSLRKGLDLTKTEKDKQPNSFVLYNFYNRAITKVQRVSERYRRMDEAYKEVCNMFSENSKTKEPCDFFQVFIDFFDQYKKAEKENERLRNPHQSVATTTDSTRNSKTHRKVANEAAMVAKKRMSVTETKAGCLSNRLTQRPKSVHSDINGNIWIDTNNPITGK